MQIKQLAQTLEDIKRVNAEGQEYWSARDLYPLLGYFEWRKFEGAIDRAKESCVSSENQVEDHFVGADKMVGLGSGSERKIEDFNLTRFACYLIAQNGDPRKPEIAFAQVYFAMAARKQELLEKTVAEFERLVARRQLRDTEKEFAKTLCQRDVDGKGIAEIRGAGDQVLFNSSTKKMKEKLGVEGKTPLADVLPTVTIKAKDLAAEMTTVNTKKKDLYGKEPIKGEHIRNNRGVRKALVDADIVPEELPAEEDVKKLEKRYAKRKGISP
jgi:DNA-damage-inducible protein D